MTSTVSINLDLRAGFGPVRDQGARPTCLAFATSDAHAHARDDLAPLSCEYLYYHAQRRGGRTPSTGASLPHVLNALREDGQPIEAGWPYLVAVPSDLTSWVPPIAAAPVFARKGSALPPTLAEIRGALATGRAVVALLKLSKSFFWATPGVLVLPQQDEPVETPDRHAVVVVADGMVDGAPALLVRNSWGSGWGDSGHAWLSDDYIAPRLFGAAILTDGVDVPSHQAAA